jgi:hypothetical protein
MGFRSYRCTKCGGEKYQFDFCESCVVKLGDIYVKGKYSGYVLGYQQGNCRRIRSYLYALTVETSRSLHIL